MKPLVIVTNGNAFARLFLASTVERFADRIAQVFVVTGIRRDAGRLRSLARYAAVSGPRYVGYKALTYAVPAALRAMGRLDDPFVWQFAPRFGIRTAFVADPNDGAVIDSLRAGDEDRLLISVSCPMRIGSEVLDAATLGAINVHSSLLPADAGLAPYVWALARGAEETGVTVHVMEPRIDTGRILSAPRLRVEPGTSAMQLFLRQASAGGDALADVVAQTLRDGRLPTGVQQDPTRRSYHGMPTRAAIADLRANGHRLASAADFRRFITALRTGPSVPAEASS